MNLEQNRNEDSMRLQISRMESRLGEIMLGGGKKNIEKLHAKGKMTARERIDALLDPGSERLEIGGFAG